MKRSLFCVAIAALIALSGLEASAQPSGDPHVVTVIGDVSKPNRAASDDFNDAFFKFHEMSFEKAHGFSRKALEGLPQTAIKVHVDGWPETIAASGPKLSEVMQAAGVSDDARLTFTAFDGYAATLNAAERRERDWVLAINVNGNPMGIGGRGPAWLLYDTDNRTLPKDDEGKLIWSVFSIAAEE